MISKYLSSIDGISIFPVIGLIIFFALFILVVVKIIRLDKKFISQMGNLPLDKNNETKNNIEIKDETK